MKIDVSPEIHFQTARSGGKGGQHVNKVETMVTGSFKIKGSALLTPEQQEWLLHQLQAKLTASGKLQVKSQTFRSQLQNKMSVIKKINTLLEKNLTPKKKRIATSATRAAKEKRLQRKKNRAEQKTSRQKIRHYEE